MATVDSIKDDVISHSMASENEKLLRVIDIVSDSAKRNNTVSLSPQQIQVLMMSEHDIESDCVIPAEEELKKSEFQ